MRPVDKAWPISNPFGRKGNYAAGYHTGVDFAVPVGTQVKAVWHGKVVVSTYSGSDYGNYIEVQTFWRKKRVLYAHLSKRYVSVGRIVRRGSLLGLSGDTGNSTGPHLHVEQRHSPYGYWDHEKPTFV